MTKLGYTRLWYVLYHVCCGNLTTYKENNIKYGAIEMDSIRIIHGKSLRDEDILYIYKRDRRQSSEPHMERMSDSRLTKQAKIQKS